LEGRNILRSKVGIGQKTIKRLQNIICKEEPFNFKVCLSTDYLYFSHRLVTVVALPRQLSHSIDSIVFELLIQEFPISYLVFLSMIFKNYISHYILIL